LEESEFNGVVGFNGAVGTQIELSVGPLGKPQLKDMYEVYWTGEILCCRAMAPCTKYMLKVGVPGTFSRPVFVTRQDKGRKGWGHRTGPKPPAFDFATPE